MFVFDFNSTVVQLEDKEHRYRQTRSHKFQFYCSPIRSPNFLRINPYDFDISILL